MREELGPVLRQLDELRTRLCQQPVQPEYLTVSEASRLFVVTEGTVRRWIREGKLASSRAGRAVRLKREDLEQFMSSRTSVEGVIDFKTRAAEIVDDG